MREGDAQLLMARTVGEVAREEVEEGLHLGVESLYYGQEISSGYTFNVEII